MNKKITDLGNTINQTISPETRRYLQSEHYRYYGYYHKETLVPEDQLPDFLFLSWEIDAKLVNQRRKYAKGKRRSGRQKQK